MARGLFIEVLNSISFLEKCVPKIFRMLPIFCHNIEFRPLITEKKHMPLQTNVIYTLLESLNPIYFSCFQNEHDYNKVYVTVERS